MFGRQDFVSCITENLAARGYGKETAKELLDMFSRRVDDYTTQGKPELEANTLAMADTFNAMAARSVDKMRAINKAVSVRAELIKRIRNAENIDVARLALDGGGDSIGTKYARGLISMLEGDTRVKGGGVSFASLRTAYKNKYAALMSDVLYNYSKGFMGRQRGKADMNSIVHEIFGRSTGNANARELAQAYLRVSSTMVDDFNAAGGAMAKLDGYNLPQRHSSYRIVKAGREAYVRAHVDELLDWDRMRWPNGERIAPEDRVAAIQKVYDIKTTDGKIDRGISDATGQGGSLGDALDKHRFLIYKDSDAWLKAHEMFGDGTVMDVINAHMEGMATKTAMVEMFGRSPSAFAATARAAVEQATSKAATLNKGKNPHLAVGHAQAALRKFDAMFENVQRQNPYDANNPWAAGVHASANILTSAQLASAVFLAAPGDMVQTIAVRLANNMSLRNLVGSYIGGVAGFKGREKQMLQMGFVMDQTLAGMYSIERFTGMTTHGPETARRVSSAVMRMSGMNRHTEVLRSANRLEQMAFLQNSRNVEFDNLPTKRVFENYGITKQDWDDVRTNVAAFEPRPGTPFFRPLDILDTKLKNKKELYEKFFSMIEGETVAMVPGATIEAQTVLRGNSRADTIPGMLLHSFSMYKNFPVTLLSVYGRRALAQETMGGKLGFVAGLGLMMTGVGALGLQLRELAQGREPLPMDNTKFWGRALMAGGATSLWGDFLFRGVGEYENVLAGDMAGPIIGLAHDTANLALADGFNFITAMEDGSKFENKFPARLVEFTRRNTPGTSLWWARLALEREVWDRAREWADPQAYRKYRARERRQREQHGNEFYSRPGSRLFTGD